MRSSRSPTSPASTPAATTSSGRPAGPSEVPPHPPHTASSTVKLDGRISDCHCPSTLITPSQKHRPPPLDPTYPYNSSHTYYILFTLLVSVLYPTLLRYFTRYLLLDMTCLPDTLRSLPILQKCLINDNNLVVPHSRNVK